MKAITIQPPYAQLLAYEFKLWETSEKAALQSVVGHRIGIHCGKRVDIISTMRQSLYTIGGRQDALTIEDAINKHNLSLRDDVFDKQLGHIIATAFVSEHLLITDEIIRQQTPLERACGYWIVDYHAYRLTDVQLLPTPIPARGNVTLWECDL